MTTPAERTRALIETSLFLQELSEPGSYDVPAEVRLMATRLLRHYPLTCELEFLHKALPMFYATAIAYRSQE